MKKLLLLSSSLVVSSVGCGEVENTTKDHPVEVAPVDGSATPTDGPEESPEAPDAQKASNGCSGTDPIAWAYYQKDGQRVCVTVEGKETCIDCQLMDRINVDPQCTFSIKLANGQNLLIGFASGLNVVQVEVNDIPDSADCRAGCNLFHSEASCTELELVPET